MARGEPVVDKLARTSLALRGIYGNLVVTRNSVMAWYRLPLVSWGFKSDEARVTELTRVARDYAKLAGFDLHLRVSSRPYPVATWAANLATHHTPAPPAPGAPGPRWSPQRRRLWESWCDRQNAVQDHLRQAKLDEKEAYLGVVLAHRPVTAQIQEWVTRGRMANRETENLADTRRRVGEVVGGPGIGARPATSHEVEWLIHRSVAPFVPAPRFLEELLYASSSTEVVPYCGVDAPGLVAREDVASFTDWVSYDSGPKSKTVRVTADRDGEDVARDVAVLGMGMVDEPLSIPPGDPWLSYVERLGFPVEVSARFRVVPGADAKDAVYRRKLWARDQQSHYAEHDMPVPPALERQIRLATSVEDEMSSGSEAATRVHGTVHFAVGGTDREGALTRGRKLVDLYRERRVRIEHLPVQEAHLLAFVPGQGAVSSSHQRRMPVSMWAAGVPSMSSTLGDKCGPYVGETIRGGRKAVFWEPHLVFDRHDTASAPGLSAVLGGLGAGKSTFIGAQCYESVLRGIPATILDPSGPLARLTDMPELDRREGLSAHIDLMNSPPGTLNPYALIPDPEPDESGSRQEHQEAVSRVEMERIQLARNIVGMLLPPEMYQEHKDVIRSATRRVGGGADRSLNDVVEAMDSRDEHGRVDRDGSKVAAALDDVSDSSEARLFFTRADAGDRHGMAAALTVLTMPGLTLPPENQDKSDWSDEELLAVPLLHLACRFASRRAFDKPKDQRAMLALDEMHFLSRWPAGRTLFTRLAHDSRKHKMRVFASAKKPGNLLDLDVASLVGECFVGQISDYSVAGEALRLLGVPRDAGYEEAVMALSPSTSGRARGSREFVMRDTSGTVDQLRIDLSHNPRLLETLDTTTPVRAPGDRSNRGAPELNGSGPDGDRTSPPGRPVTGGWS